MPSILPRRVGLGLAIACLLPLTGCLGSTSLGDYEFGFTWQQSELPLPEPGEEVPFTVTGGSRTITVEGTFILPCAEGVWNPQLNVRGGTVTIHIEFQTNPVCPPGNLRMQYSAAVRNINPGVYRVVVQHRNDQRVPANTTVVDENVTVSPFTPSGA